MPGSVMLPLNSSLPITAAPPPSHTPAGASCTFRSQFEQSRDAEQPASDETPGQQPAKTSDPRFRKGAPAGKDIPAHKTSTIHINLSGVAPAIAPAAPVAGLPFRLQLTPDASADEGSAGDRSAQPAGGQADAVSPNQPPALTALPAGNLAFELKLKPLDAVTPAKPLATGPAAAAKPAMPATPASEAAPRVAPASNDKQPTEKDTSSQDGAASQDNTAPAPKIAAPALPADSTPASQVVVPAPTPQTIHHEAPKTEAPATIHAPAAIESKPTAVANPQQISLRVASPKGDDHTVEIRLTERAGEVRVAVRTPDETLARTMREDLGSLTGKLQQSGFAAESIAPSHAGSSSFSEHHGEPSNSNPDSDGGRRQSSQQQNQSGRGQQEQEENEKRPSWMEALDQSLNNRSNQWQPHR